MEKEAIEDIEIFEYSDQWETQKIILQKLTAIVNQIDVDMTKAHYKKQLQQYKEKRKKNRFFYDEEDWLEEFEDVQTVSDDQWLLGSSY